MITRLLEGNRQFVAETFEKERAFFEELSKQQKPTVLWIGCSDSRISVNTITSTRPGEIFIHRNVGNVVATNDWNLSAVLEFSINRLRIPDIVICGHYGCGGMAALDAENEEDKYIPVWLINAHEAKERVDGRIRNLDVRVPPVERMRLIVEENVSLQLEHLGQYPFVKRARKEGRLSLHGWVYDIFTGEIRDLKDE